MNTYLDYEEYKKFGGTLDESAFPPMLIDAQSKLNYLTNGNLDKFVKEHGTTIPDEIKRLIISVISLLDANKDMNSNVSSYSNGIETFGYKAELSKQQDLDVITLMNSYLWEYPELMYRGRRCIQKQQY